MASSRSRLLNFVIISLLCVANIRGGYICEENWLLFQESCYFISKNDLAFSTAEDECRTMDSHMASVATPDEHFFLQNTAPFQTTSDPSDPLGTFGYHIGLVSDRDPNSLDFKEGWYWIDGTPYEWINWAKQEPDKSDFCAKLVSINYEQETYGNKTWWGSPCGVVAWPFICEKDATFVTESTTEITSTTTTTETTTTDTPTTTAIPTTASITTETITTDTPTTTAIPTTASITTETTTTDTPSTTIIPSTATTSTEIQTTTTETTSATTTPPAAETTTIISTRMETTTALTIAETQSAEAAVTTSETSPTQSSAEETTMQAATTGSSASSGYATSPTDRGQGNEGDSISTMGTVTAESAPQESEDSSLPMAVIAAGGGGAVVFILPIIIIIAVCICGRRSRVEQSMKTGKTDLETEVSFMTSTTILVPNGANDKTETHGQDNGANGTNKALSRCNAYSEVTVHEEKYHGPIPKIFRSKSKSQQLVNGNTSDDPHRRSLTFCNEYSEVALPDNDIGVPANSLIVGTQKKGQSMPDLMEHHEMIY